MSETIDWLKKVSKPNSSKSKLSFDYEENDETLTGAEESVKEFHKPKANAMKIYYNSNDLKGLQVAHNLESFQPGQSDILVLDDQSVLEDRDEALISVSLKEEARLKRLREVARHSKGYSGYKAYEEEVEEEDTVIFGPRNKINSAKVLQKYDFASSEFNDEPGLEEGFKIGSSGKTTKPLEGNHQENVKFNEFDTVQAAGIDTLNIIKKKRSNDDFEKEKKRAKKLAKTFFADEPEMIVEADTQEIVFNDRDEDDDSDMQRIISVTRRDNLKSLNNFSIENEEIDAELFPKSCGKSFDTLIMSESIFATKQQEYTAKDITAITEESALNEEMEPTNYSETFSAEPLVRDGVASTLALLNMHGINLKARGSRDGKTPSSSDINLEYFDQFGNKLTSKEAYKELSRKFHGKAAGKGKVEKMKNRRKETLAMENANSSKSVIVENLRKQQQETGAPYMVVSNTRQQHSEITETKEKSDVKPKIFGLQLKK